MGFLDKLSSKLESKQQTFSSPSSQPETQKPAVDPSLGLPAGGLAVNGSVSPVLALLCRAHAATDSL